MTTTSQAKPLSRTRRTFALGLALLPAIAFAQKSASKPVVEVWKTPTCGCCKDWLTHLRDNGFDVAAHDVQDTVAARKRAQMPERYASCHTGMVQGYALEGHVPAREIKRLLRERPRGAEHAAWRTRNGWACLWWTAHGLQRAAHRRRWPIYRVSGIRLIDGTLNGTCDE